MIMMALGPDIPPPIALGKKIILTICICPLLVPAFVLQNPAPIQSHKSSFRSRIFMFRQDPSAVTANAAACRPESYYINKAVTVLSIRATTPEIIRCTLLRGRFTPLTSNLSHRESNVNYNLSCGGWSSSATLHHRSGRRSRSSEMMRHAASGSIIQDGNERSEREKRSKRVNGGAKGGGRGENEESSSEAKADRGDEGGGLPGYREGVKAEFSRQIDCSELLSRKSR